MTRRLIAVFGVVLFGAVLASFSEVQAQSGTVPLGEVEIVGPLLGPEQLPEGVWFKAVMACLEAIDNENIRNVKQGTAAMTYDVRAAHFSGCMMVGTGAVRVKRP